MQVAETDAARGVSGPNDPATGPAHSARRFALIWAALLAVTLWQSLLLWPRMQRFAWYAFGDPGCNLSLVALLQRGARPMVEFGYNYGLLSVLAADLWSRVFGLTPRSYVGFMTVGQVVLAGAMAAFAVAVRARWAGLAFLVVSAPFTLTFTPHFAHAMEPALIGLAFAAHARGRRSTALVLLTLACATKPAMAYVYGLVLLIMTLRDLFVRQASVREWVGTLGPATVCAALLGVGLAAIYGPTSLLHTALPTAGTACYKYYNFGFFRGVGRAFWDPTGRTINYYIGNVVGTWIPATLVLLVAGLVAGVRWLRRSDNGPDAWRDEVIVAAALLHVAFVTLAWGHQFTWYYYYYALILGVVAASAAWRPVAWLVGLMAVAAIPAWVMFDRSALAEWRSLQPSPEMAGLWASADERAAWDEVRKLTAGRRTAALSHQGGGAEVLFPEFAPATSWIYNRGIASDAEIAVKARQIADVDAVIVANVVRDPDAFLDLFPEFRAALAGFDRRDVGTDYAVYLRRGTAPR